MVRVVAVAGIPDLGPTGGIAEEGGGLVDGRHHGPGDRVRGRGGQRKAAGAALYYLGETQKGRVPHVRRIQRYQADDYIALDPELGRMSADPDAVGMVGSTDSHTSMSTAEEENFFGKHSGVEPEQHRWEHVVIEAPDLAHPLVPVVDEARGADVLRYDVEGVSFLGGEPVSLRSPKHALSLGIGAVHQHSRLVEALTAAENLFVGWDEIPGLFRRRSALVKRGNELAEKYGLGVSMEARVWQLSVRTSRDSIVGVPSGAGRSS